MLEYFLSSHIMHLLFKKYPANRETRERRKKENREIERPKDFFALFSVFRGKIFVIFLPKGQPVYQVS